MVSTLNNTDLQRFQTYKKRMKTGIEDITGIFRLCGIFFHAKCALLNDMQMGMVIKDLFEAYVW